MNTVNGLIFIVASSAGILDKLLKRRSGTPGAVLNSVETLATKYDLTG